MTLSYKFDTIQKANILLSLIKVQNSIFKKGGINMANGSFWSRLFGFDDSIVDSKEADVQQADMEEKQKEGNDTTLQDAIKFVVQLQSYYYNEICKKQANLAIQTGMSEDEKRLNQKRIQQEQSALSQIDEILESIKKEEEEYQEVFAKKFYDFFDELKENREKSVKENIFALLARLCTVNIYEELEEIILNRIKVYKEAWNIENTALIIKSSNAILMAVDGNIETYRFGNFVKRVYVGEREMELFPERLDRIKKMTIGFDEGIHVDEVWVYTASVPRFKLDFMRKTCILDSNWEVIKDAKSGLYFDVVKMTELDEYIRGILQIVLTKETYAVISIIFPTAEMLSEIGPVNQNGNKIEVCWKYAFYLKERNGIYKGNLMTARIDRRNIPEELKFISYLKFRKKYF